MADRLESRYTVPLGSGVRALPIVHGSVEYTIAVREYLTAHRPMAVAVELPEHLREPLERALPDARHIPFITTASSGDEHSFHLILEPLEPIVEAVRTAHERDIPFHLVDRFDGRHTAWLPESFPDTYALRMLTPVELFDLYRKHIESSAPTLIDALINRIDRGRELHMARRLRQLAAVLDPDERDQAGIIFVGGIRHVAALQRLMSLSNDEFSTESEQAADLPEDVALGEEEPLEALLRASEFVQEQRRVSILSRKSSEVLEQPAFFNTAWNVVRERPDIVSGFNRVDLLRAAYRETVNRYERITGELIPPQREKLFFRFARNWSVVAGRLLPDTYRMVISARSFGNDNFARVMYNVLNELPPARGTIHREEPLTLDDLHRDSRLIRFRMKVKIKRKVPPADIVRRFRREKYPGEWREAWRGSGICSYPPEDIQVEDFGRYLQTRARAILQGSETRTLPFTASLLDGIDYRETIRNLPLGKVFVKDVRQRGLEAGSVVIVFSEDTESYPWRQVWWGEHQQESDMAFYATAPGEHMAGPGITRCRYGGLMLTYPPGRIHDIWADPSYRDFENPADLLLVGALVYNERNAVVHLSNRAPNAKLSQLAGRMGQKIIHIPLSTISSEMLGRIQRFHVLDSRERRDEADDHIW